MRVLRRGLILLKEFLKNDDKLTLLGLLVLPKNPEQGQLSGQRQGSLESGAARLRANICFAGATIQTAATKMKKDSSTSFR